jgi:hypothetical protein
MLTITSALMILHVVTVKNMLALDMIIIMVANIIHMVAAMNLFVVAIHTAVASTVPCTK